MAAGKFVSYLRVSTDKQGERGLGIEAQRKAVEDYLNGGDWQLIAEFVEVESGKRNDRPKLAEAMRHAKVTGATLLIAKLDRLSRNAHFLLGLQDAGVDFIACDLPQANRLTVGIMALVAEQEREAISARTKAALAAAKAKGTWVSRSGRTVSRLGHIHGAAPLRAAGAGKPGWTIGAEGTRRAADAFAARVRPVIEDIRASGITTLEGIAAELNARGILTARGDGRWYAGTVKRLLARLGGPN
jgi:DNA invertase Pin-like site-specific DNA recombinase